MVTHAGAVLFAKDFRRLASFYQAALGLTSSTIEDDHAVLICGEFDLVVHQIPRHLADSITIEAPARRRENAAIKLCFPVASVETARAAAAALAGTIDSPATEWIDGDTVTCMGHDPEGNVFQVRAPNVLMTHRRPYL